MMKREVSPIVVVLGILALLVTVEVVYWRLLGPTKSSVVRGGSARGGGAGGGGEGDTVDVPRGDPRYAIATFAGAPGPDYRDGSAADARFDGPADVAVSPDGTVYVADSRNHAVRRISPAGVVTTVVGGPTSRVLSAPAGVEVLSDGSLLVADTGHHRICKIADGRLTTLAGADTVRDEFGRPVGGYQNGPVGQAQFRYPVGLAEGTDGAVYVADAGNHCVRRIANGIVTTVPVAGGGMGTPTHLTLGLYDNLRITDTATGCVWSGAAAGPLARAEIDGNRQLFAAPSGISVTAFREEGEASFGSTYLVADSRSHCLYCLDARGAALVAGMQGTPGWTDGPGDQARFSQPAGVCEGSDGTVYVADFGNNCIRAIRLPYLGERDEWPAVH